jgi:hypothetical protein
MLVKVIDHKNKAWWVNPAYVRGLIDRGGGRTTIDVSGWPGHPKVDVPIDEVAGLLNLAMENLALDGATIAEQVAQSEAEQQAQQTAAIAAIVIGG